MREKKKLRVALIGCGVIAADHAETLKSKCGPVELHLCDLDTEAAKKLGQRVGIGFEVHKDACKLIAERELDVVHVLTPPDSHFKIASYALQNRSHVFVEKPMALRLSETKELFAVAEKMNRMICVGHSLLFMESVRKAFEIIENNVLGDVIYVHCFFGHAESRKTISYGGVSHWAYRLPGGPLTNLISHPASLLVALLGEPKVISSISNARNLMPYEFSDLLNVSVSTFNRHGSFTISMAHGNSSRYANIECEKGSVYIDLARQLIIVGFHKGRLGFISKALSGIGQGFSFINGTVKVISKVAIGRLKRNPGTRELVARFYDSVRNGLPCPVDKQNAIGVATICEEVFYKDNAEVGDVIL